MFVSELDERRIIEKKNTYMLLADLVWDDGIERIVIPKGFIYNGGSVPRPLWWFIPPKGTRADRAFCLHDWLYVTEYFDREKCDKLMLKAMESDKFNSIGKNAAYQAVDKFGWYVWNGHNPEEVKAIREWAGLDVTD